MTTYKIITNETCLNNTVLLLILKRDRDCRVHERLHKNAQGSRILSPPPFFLQKAFKPLMQNITGTNNECLGENFFMT